MKMFRIFVGLLLAAVLSACGGGGGSPGTVGGGTGGGSTGGTGSTPSNGTPTVAIQLLDASNNPVASVTRSPVVYAKATLRNASGAVVPAQVVTFTGDASLVQFVPASGTALTDANGVATIQVVPASASSAGAGMITAAATLAGVAVTPGTVSFQVPVLAASSGSPSLSLGMRDASNSSTNIVSSSSVTNARAVLLDGSGKALPGTLVTFTGDPTLIKFSPAAGTVLTDSTGAATIQISPASASSAGAGTLRASATVGSTAIAQTFDFQIASVTNAGVPTIKLGLLDASNTATNSVSASGVTTAHAVVQDAAGNPVVGKLVTIIANPTLVKMNPASGQVLTDSSGAASLQLTAASLNAAGASTMTATTNVAGAALTTSFDYQLSAANLALTNLNLGSGPVPAYGNRAVSVGVTVNGVAATNTPVQVTFSASCGSVTPASVTTDGTGTASTTYKADSAACSGSNVTISASASGAAPLSGTVAVAASLATNMQFVSAAPQMIYLVGSVGATQSLVSFKVLDSTGNPLQNQQVQLSIVNSAPGVSLNAVGNTAPVTLSSDAAGVVSVAVFSGTVPTSVQVRAALVSNTSVTATSNVLTVASGRPVQRSLSIALKSIAIEGWSVDGATTQVTLSMSDRQGNPVPDGTQVNFTSGYGVLLPASCVVSSGTSSCAVTFRSQGTRPTSGRVAILAYVPGEEDFVDLNGNNVYDAGEPFSDLGNAFRDEYTPLPNGILDAGEFYVPRAGSTSCSGGVNGVANTCDGVWGAADVRAEAELIEASSTAKLTAKNVTRSGFTVTVADVNSNSMPTGSTISSTLLTSPPGSSCAVSSTLPKAVPNTPSPTDASISTTGCIGGEVIGVTVTAPSGTESQLTVTLP